MRRLLTALFVSSLLSSHALAAPVVVWLEQQAPEDKYMRKAEGTVGLPADHLAHVDLAFPPTPWSKDDTTRLEAVRAAVIRGNAAWNEFDSELQVAMDLLEALEQVTVVRDAREAGELADAYLLQGAAVSQAFPPLVFLESPDAEPFRATVPGARVNRPWLTAIAMQPGRMFDRSDIADGGPYPAFQALQSVVRDLPKGFLDAGGLRGTARVVVDGLVIDSGVKKVELAPGTHFVHLLRGSVISGRQRVVIEAGLTKDLPMLVTQAELDQAAATLLGGSIVGFPDSVVTSLDAIAKQHREGVYVATVEDGRVVTEPWGAEAEKPKKRPVTVVLAGEIGGGVQVSTLWEDSGGDKVTAPVIHGGLGLEVGIYYGAILGGFDVGIAPGNTIKYANGDSTENRATSVLPQGWGGLGAYVLRPNKKRATLLLAGTYGWYGPAHQGFGGRLSLGIPLDDGTWFRITTGGVSGKPAEAWQDAGIDAPMQMLFMRLGFATRF